MVAKRGRPSKKVAPEPQQEEENLEQQEVNEVETPETEDENVEVEVEEAPEPVKDDSSVIGSGTSPDYNPFDTNVVEREYSTPKVASGVTESIEEPQFVPPTYEDIKQQKEMEGMEGMEEEGGGEPFADLSNPALNDLNSKDKKIACESLVDTALDTYEQLHKFAQYSVKVDEEELQLKHQQGKIDLTEQIPVSETQNMSVGEFMGQFNKQSEEALAYDQEFGVKVRPAMIRVFMKRGWGMSDEQFLMYMFGKDIAIKVGIMYQLKKTISSTLDQLEKAHKQNKARGYSPPPPDVQETYKESEVLEDEEDLEEEIDDIIIEGDVPKVSDNFSDSMQYRYASKPKRPTGTTPRRN
jgi:hypothetical protein